MSQIEKAKQSLFDALAVLNHIPEGLTCHAAINEVNGCEGCQYEWSYAANRVKEALEYLNA